MPPVDLVFSRPPLTGSPVNLVFGETDAALIPSASAQIAGTLPGGLTFSAQARDVRRVQIAGVLPSSPLVFLADARYASNTARPTVGHVASAFQPAMQLPAHGITSAMQGVLQLPAGVASAWALAVDTAAQVSASHSQNAPTNVAVTVDFDNAQTLPAAQFVAKHQEAYRSICAAIKSLFDNTKRLDADPVSALHQEAYRDRQGSVASAWQNADQRVSVKAMNRAGRALNINVSTSSAYQNARRPPPGMYTPPGMYMPPANLCYTPSSHLLFDALAPASLNLVFVCERHGSGTQPITLSILPARFYMTTHSLIAQRVPDMAPVPLYSATISADAGSFAWQFSATGPESLFAQLAPTDGPASSLPQQIQLALDGMVWTFLVESIKRSHSFGNRTVSISGRSTTALLGAPWRRDTAFNNSDTFYNAQQLAAKALQFTGVALDWGITDWLVPVNAWSAFGTPLSAVQAIAEAAGGYLQSHRSASTLQVRHPYPERPSGDNGGYWNWGIGAADVELAPDAVITSGIDRRDGPDVNAVYASGTSAGVIALIKRVGSAGDKLASLQTDALITAVQAAQQRGIAVLGKAGPQYAITLELPILSGIGQPGVIDVGSLVQVNEATPWRGRVRSVSVNAAMPTARQTVTLERHL